RVVESISKDGKPTKKKIRTRVIKKVKGDKQEVTKIETVEEDDKKPQTTVTVEETPIDEQPEEVKELPEEVRVVESISKDGKPTKKKIRTRVIKKVKGDKQEVTKIETVEEADEKPHTTVTVEEAPIDEQPEEVKELPEEVRVVESISIDGKLKKKKIRTRTIMKVKGNKQEVIKIETVDEDDKKPQTTVTIEKAPIDEQPEEVKEFPEEVRIVESIAKDGKPTKKKIRTRLIKKVKGDKQEVTKIETVEEDDKKPHTTVTVEEAPIDEQPEEIKELPEEVRVVESISKDGKPTKKKIRTRIIKKIKGDKQEVTKIETVEEDDKKPQTTVIVEETSIDEQREEIKELPEEVRVVESISIDGKPTKKKIRTRVIKKVKGDKQEVTKIETVEEDDKNPQTTVTVEETPIDEQPEEIKELPEEVRIVESISKDGKFTKKKIRTRIIKKIKGDKREVTKIETVEEDDKKPQTTVT
ncbi:titin-like, partial [Glossina fuscipes]|uniref:Titin-like n=1 Tax=Glossina fuscipes TaxID=7396 RepID=A0A9C5ZGN9_9MUSC